MKCSIILSLKCSLISILLATSWYKCSAEPVLPFKPSRCEVGGIKTGDSLKNFESRWGKPDRGTGQMDQVHSVEYLHYGLEINASGDRIQSFILPLGSASGTPNDLIDSEIVRGSTPDEVASTLGSPKSIVDDHELWATYVYMRPRCAVEVTYEKAKNRGLAAFGVSIESAK